MHDKPLAIAYIDDRSVRLVGNRAESNWARDRGCLVALGATPNRSP